MGLLSWIIGRAPRASAPPPPVPVVIGRPQIPAPSPNTLDTDLLATPDADGRIELESIHTVIDYCDTYGAHTRRRITVTSVEKGPYAPLLSAYCHERDAMRTFRCDRIECFIDQDGVVSSCYDFFRNILLVDINALDAQHSRNETPLDIARVIRQRMHAPLSLLVTAARCDGDFHIEELDVICQYAERELASDGIAACHAHEATLEVVNHLPNVIPKLRPNRAAMECHVERVSTLPDAAQKRFLRTLQRVISADGQVLAEESELLQEIDEMLASSPSDPAQGLNHPWQ